MKLNLAQLNPTQLAAVEHINGPLLILAGAGSGKTRVLTHRMANLICQGHASSEEILAVTFTNKAAREMESRIYQILAENDYPLREQLWVSTFHSFCVRVLKKHIELLDYKPFFVIYDDGDQLSLIKKIMQNLNINDKLYPAKNFRAKINSAKMLGLNPDQLSKRKDFMFDEKSIQVYRQYEVEMKKANALDFGDLLVKTYDLFQMYPDLLKQYQEKFKFIMVDEYQDTNHIQYLLVQKLSSGHRNLCVVGDEDQSIYSWRGADIKNILDFEKDFPEAKVVKLEENYRSSANIVQAASSVIRNNNERKDKTLFTSNEPGDLITVREEKNEYEEARFVAKSIQTMMNDGHGSFSDYAVFYRTNAQSRVLEEQLRTHSIPYQIVGGVRFYDRMEIKDVLGYMKMILNPADDISFKRIINVPARGIGKTTIEKLEEFATEKQKSMFACLEEALQARIFNSGTNSKLRAFQDLMLDLQKLSKLHSLVDFYPILLERSEYLAKLKKEDSVESESRIQNLEELGNALVQFSKERTDASLQTFLEEMALVSDLDSMKEEKNSVTLMTLHVSKGLEFPYVFIVGLEENLFPSLRGEEDDENSVEEERRLAYVGMTRARERLHLTYAKTRRVWGQDQFNLPSRFLKEIPTEFVSFSSCGADRPRFLQKALEKNPSSSFDFDRQDFPDYEADSGSGSDSYYKGQKVKHPTFGMGSVFQIEGSGDQTKVSVLFRDQTIKKFVLKYARLEKM